MLTVAGFQVPEIPLEDAVGNAGTPPPEQMDSAVPKEKLGVMFGFTVTERLAVTAHCPAPGVNT